MDEFYKIRIGTRLAVRTSSTQRMEFIPQNSIYAGTLPVCEGAELTKRLHAWKTGTTGFPAIDAAIEGVI